MKLTLFVSSYWSSNQKRLVLNHKKYKLKHKCTFCISSGWRTETQASLPTSPLVLQVVKKDSSKTETSVALSSSSSDKGEVKLGLKSDSLGTLPFWVFGAVFIVGIRLYTNKHKKKKEEAAERKNSLGETSEVETERIPEKKTILEEEQENSALHVFKCANCGYSLFPAKGREFKFFTDSFKCPACGSTKEAFYDTSDPNDPRNKREEEEEEEIKESS
ncbi:hypothetical protein Gasu2_18620 [Galdieria sulphuraria]|uniref:Rubredoxin-like domain-containing protein n=1 Tax=Galdieria sulphuraria TaxID=130081 RepID=M2WXM4_GALSU|nr:hypothetical protein Gasu_36960 isoform 1 [Galdieria sulphuraria]XP_005705325.1 hypothetical protein Gasu_36960 isoform 2 [Galdieria sulphuraria]EME28804.1 hypothetical protein isoform 1 [Galdieria sulphuraria]EME28805.1 hypothetical protein isoform 2 [Galdieria sulphuraria]GJD07503.1 hypothetical protein Gasu2_18620 [Galdieria sulphuraria]|eukprot:XP_005705324.1 hypothetical protein isoform 1 [Galdieria sulphuraria]